MAKVIKLKRGLDIPLKGEAVKELVSPELPVRFAVKPVDFKLIRPKMMVRADDIVKAGTPLFFDKFNPDVLFTSPVSGRIIAVNRGERRKILEVVVKRDDKIIYEGFEKNNPARLTREEIARRLLKAGLWPLIKQRPFGIIPRPADKPRSIFISGFDSAPLAPDYGFIMEGTTPVFQAGIDALKKLTDGKIHLNVSADRPVPETYKNTRDVQLNYFSGPHPAGNPGVQIHHIDPIHKNGTVWQINPQDVLIIGRLFMDGRVDFSRIVAVTGSEVLNPRYYSTMMGASVTSLLKNNLKEGTLRFISGNVLTGNRIPADGFISFFDSQLTVIPEGKHHRFMGWAEPGINRYSVSRSFLSSLRRGHKFVMDTNYNGGPRAFVMTGVYEKVVPMDIFPQELIKSIIVEDIDRMENLGIYEVIEEDLALCEYVCPSKMEIQSILRNGMDLIIKETS
jgi:Na+-transporting NADH:ubiquinone oxidoreductase subunit A